jgi:hypothetical protein
MGEVAWPLLVALGAFHGLNPAMGWLFAVSRGFQEQSGAAVKRSLTPLALGHAASIALVVGAFLALGTVIEGPALSFLGAAILIGFGVFKLAKPFSHPRWVGMRVGSGQLVLWSFLMATAHGAGLMLLPALGGLSAAPELAIEPHISAAGVIDVSLLPAVLAVFVHTLAMLLVAGAVAVVVFERVGLSFLRKSWLNVDLLWAIALIAAGAYLVLLGFA